MGCLGRAVFDTESFFEGIGATFDWKKVNSSEGLKNAGLLAK
jgi:hypothetical protein